MSQWTDFDFVTGPDLISLDSEVEQVASAEGITLDDPVHGRAILHRSIEDAGDAVMAQMQQFGGYLSTQSVSANHYAAVMNVGLPAVQRSKILLSQVPVTTQVDGEWSSLKRWVAYTCLAGFYRDAANRTNNDRYDVKAKRYRASANTYYWERMIARGLPIVRAPLPCPGAVYEPGVGTWSASNVTAQAQGAAAGGTWDVAITWVQAGPSNWVSPTNNQNSESGPSATITQACTTAQALNVSIAGLLAPNGTQPPSTVSTALVAYGVASGWMIYAGSTGGTLYLQTQSPLPLSTTNFTLPSDPVQSGPSLGTGQWPDLFYTFTRTLQRA